MRISNKEKPKRALNWCSGLKTNKEKITEDQDSECDLSEEAFITEGIKSFVRAKSKVKHEVDVVNKFRRDENFESIQRNLKQKRKDADLEKSIQELYVFICIFL